jgi:hypothetical protein
LLEVIKEMSEGVEGGDKESKKVEGIDEVIHKINGLIGEKESDSSGSKSSNAYKQQIRDLNGVIDTLVKKIQTPMKDT